MSSSTPPARQRAPRCRWWRWPARSSCWRWRRSRWPGTAASSMPTAALGGDAETLRLELGHDGEMIRWPDAVHRCGAGQAGRPHPAAALPGRASQDVVDPRIRDDAVGQVTVAVVPGETGLARVGVAPRVDEHLPG